MSKQIFLVVLFAVLCLLTWGAYTNGKKEGIKEGKESVVMYITDMNKNETTTMPCEKMPKVSAEGWRQEAMMQVYAPIADINFRVSCY